jgi:hypothetical protein
MESFTLKDNFQSPPAQPVRNYFFHSDQKQWKGSMSTIATMGPFFIQGSGLLSFNEPNYNSSTGNYDYHADHHINFLVIGYRTTFKDRDVKNLEVSLQTRNLVLSDTSDNEFYRFRYVGLGAKVEW